MTAKNYMTSDDLIKSIKRRAFIPSNQSTFSDEDFLALADEELAIGLVPTVMSMHEDYFLYVEEITIGAGRSFGVEFQDAGNLVVLPSHGFDLNEMVTITELSGSSGIALNQSYFAVNITTNTFQLSTLADGSAIDIIGDGSGVVSISHSNSRFPIPYRAIGSKLREVALKDETGNFFEMTRIGVGQLPYYNGGAHGVRPYAFYIENNEVVLAPERVSFVYGAKIRLTYYMRPNSLVKLDQVAIISSINRATGELAVNNVPDAFAADHSYDIVSIKSPHKTLKFDIGAVSINSTNKTITLNADDLPANLAIGDHICLAGTSAIPQVPADLHVVLAHRVAARCLEAMGDTEGLAAANQKLAEMTKLGEYMIDDRVEDAPRKVNNRHATIRSGLSRRSRFRRF